MDRRTRFVLSSFYFTNFAALGLFVPYFSIYARSLGFSATRIGMLLALIPLGKAVLPAVWGAAADRAGTRRVLLVVSTWAAAVAFAGFLLVESYVGCLAVMAVWSALSVPALPFVEATTLEKIDTTGAQYGRIRVFGSLGFALAALTYGWLARDAAAFTVVPVHLALLIATAVAASLVPVATSPVRPSLIRARDLLANGRLVLLLAAGFLMQASHGAYIGFLSLVLLDAGYAGWVIGGAWAGAIAAEVIVLMVAATLARRLGHGGLMALSVAIAAARWALYAMTVAPAALALGQALHGFTYAGFHVAAVSTIHRLVPAGGRATGQAIYSGWTYGAGLMIGTSLAGAMKDGFGDSAMFGFESALAVGALVLILLGVGRRRAISPGGTGSDPLATPAHR